jgi:NAD(P)-dependent dehydrogenase (short-subunit alcohol dehydrogenase family)
MRLAGKPAIGTGGGGIGRAKALASAAEGAIDAGARVSEVLGAITNLAQTSPFKDLKSPSVVVQGVLQS